MPSESTAQMIISTVARPTDSPCLMRLGHQRPRETRAGSTGAEGALASGAVSVGTALLAALAVSLVRQKEGRIWPVSPERGLPVLPAGRFVGAASLVKVVSPAL